MYLNPPPEHFEDTNAGHIYFLVILVLNIALALIATAQLGLEHNYRKKFRDKTEGKMKYILRRMNVVGQCLLIILSVHFANLEHFIPPLFDQIVFYIVACTIDSMIVVIVYFCQKAAHKIKSKRKSFWFPLVLGGQLAIFWAIGLVWALKNTDLLLAIWCLWLVLTWPLLAIVLNLSVYKLAVYFRDIETDHPNRTNWQEFKSTVRLAQATGFWVSMKVMLIFAFGVLLFLDVNIPTVYVVALVTILFTVPSTVILWYTWVPNKKPDSRPRGTNTELLITSSASSWDGSPSNSPSRSRSPNTSLKKSTPHKSHFSSETLTVAGRHPTHPSAVS